MLTALYMLWFAFNGRITWEVAGIGAVITAVLYLFCVKFLDYSLRRELRMLKMIPAGIAYAALLLYEIVKSSFHVMRIVGDKGYVLKPQLITFHTPLQTTLAQNILANSITLTPGTLSVFCEGDKITVHCLDKSFAKDIESLAFQKRLQRLEALGVK
ncbi:MAG TPA: Na+/H+ antiporter subunit E [Candidatus Limiplasma sp.]|nr:Na+/H+ antiporter subunit E [Candidatus Limiplasma sp.]HRX08290.1 Na+/H+ antiporter subunit E [Candidatus Limiplasma sp.]